MAGLLVYRLKWRLRTPLGFGSLSLLLLLALVMPYARGAWMREAAVIVVYFPLLVALGAGAVVTPRMERLCRFSGELSYPLYMSHYAVIWIWGDFAEKHHLASGHLGLAVTIGVFSMVAFGWLVLKLYDQPMRTYLRAHYGEGPRTAA
jgi:peptidoglycan/LPS O-acetylase OafA/YrhL